MSERANEVQHCSYDRVLKEKSAIRIHCEIMKLKKAAVLHFWSRGFCVSTVGLDEETIRKYIRDQENREKQQLDFDLA